MIMETSGAILIVEDQPADRDTLARFLRAENYRVDSAPSASAALERTQDSIDLVLSDVRLGGASGIDLLKAWKRRQPETPFILMTAFAEIGAAVEAVKAGAEDYLVKPVRPNELLAKISQCLASARRKQNAAGAGGEPAATDHGSNGVNIAVNMPLDELERIAIERTLDDCRGNRTHAAQALGISVRTLQRKLKAWNGASAPTAMGPK
jgi:DNA-binding NtrC family response regulator